MGARQSRRSVDITTTPKKEGIPAEGGDATAPGDGKLERIEEADTKPTTNGIAPHTDVTEDKDKDKDDATEKEKDKDKPEEVKAEETKQEPAAESPAETTEVTTPTEATPASPNTATSPDSKETKKKEKMKKKWSFRSISFSKKDKNKPAREEAPKNGDVTKEEPLAEEIDSGIGSNITRVPAVTADAKGGEEAENGSTTAGSPVEEKSTASSPTAETESAPVAAAAAAAAPASTPAAPASAAPASETAPASEPAATEVKEESPASAPSKPAVEKTEEPAPSVPTPVPVEDKKEESEKVQAEKKVVEVSPAGGQFVPDPVEVSVFRVQTVATPSIIERKTSEDIPSLPPSSPPPTPIDSSPLQRAQQAAETATALAKALSLPAEAADKDLTTQPALSSLCPELNDPSTPVAESLESNPQKQPSPSTDETPRTEPTVVPSSVETRPTSVIDTESSNTPVASTTENLESLSSGDGKKTVEAFPSLPVTECPASTPFDVPYRPESSLSESSAGQERVTNAPCAAEGDLVVMSLEMKVDEKIEPPSCAVVLQAAGVVERSSVPLDTIHDASCSSPIEKTGGSDAAVSEGAVKEASAECTGKAVEELVDLNEVTPEEVERVKEEAVIGPITSATDMVVDSEEGPMPVSDETLVEAKPAVVIPEDEEAVDADADICRVDTRVEDKLETEIKSNIVVPMEEVAASEKPVEAQDCLVSNAAIESTTENVTAGGNPEAMEIEEETMPPPLPESPVPSLQEKFDSENVNVVNNSITVPSPVVDAVPQLINVEDTNKVDGSPLSGQQIETPKECPVMDIPTLPADEPSPQILDSSSCHESEHPSRISSCTVEHARDPTDDLPSNSEETVQRIDSSNCPLPLENPSCPLNASETKNELPVTDGNVPSPRTQTETLLTPPRSPSPQSNVSITSALTTSTKDSSQTHMYDDQSNREFKMESVSISLNSYNESDIELRERLAESLAETEKQEESSVSCQLSNNATSPTTVQETHQSTPENETPVENNVAHDSTTESSDETSKVTPPAVPSETPASPPSAPAITEDVASVAKAIEEMDINDKIAASATILYNTNEIIVDAHYQNNINE